MKQEGMVEGESQLVRTYIDIHSHVSITKGTTVDHHETTTLHVNSYAHALFNARLHMCLTVSRST